MIAKPKTAFEFVCNRTPPTRLENLEAMKEAAQEFLRRYGCCGCYEKIVERDKCEHPSGDQGVCYEPQGDTRLHLYRRVCMSIFIGVEETEDWILYQARQRAYYERAALCPRFVKERLDAAMADLIAFDQKIKAAQMMVRGASGELERTVAIAKGIKAIGEAIDPHREDIMYLQNSPLGFLTDNAERGYPWEVVRNVMIDALLRGFSMTGNEVNIIAARMYAAKNGLERLLRECVDYTDQRIEFELPQIVPFGDHTIAMVGGVATWNLAGKPGKLQFQKSAAGDFRIPVKLNKGMGVDAAFGKATRKVYARILSIIQGVTIDERDTDEEAIGAAVDGQSTPSVPAIESSEITDDDREFLSFLPADVAQEQSVKSLHALYNKCHAKRPHLESRMQPIFTERREMIENRSREVARS